MKYKIRDFCHLCLGTLLVSVLTAMSAKAQEAEYYESPFAWRTVKPGLQTANYYFQTTAPIKTEVILFKVDPSVFSVSLVTAQELGQQLSDIRSMTKHIDGLIGINANFFDTSGNALGLLRQNSTTIQKVHSGGKTLSGIFYLTGTTPKIAHRNEEIPPNTVIAFQAGPRLIVNHQPIELSTTDIATRRSGVAVTEDNMLIIYATQLRFPGATLVQTQQMLMDRRLEVKDALNLDGGSSSQLYVQAELVSPGNEIYISGGDAIPVGLVIKSKQVKNH